MMEKGALRALSQLATNTNIDDFRAQSVRLHIGKKAVHRR